MRLILNVTSSQLQFVVSEDHRDKKNLLHLLSAEAIVGKFKNKYSNKLPFKIFKRSCH